MKRMLLLLAGAGVLAMAGSASARIIPTTHGKADLAIRHVHFGCHAWERGGVDAGTAQKTLMYVGQALSIVNRDSVDHTLVQTSGPATVAPTSLAHGSAADITFFVPGTYTFRTEEAAHQPSMRDGIGDPKDVPDNVLTLRVVVVSEHD